MKNLHFVVLASLLLSGCLSSKPLECKVWNLEFCGEQTKAEKPVFGSCRLLQVGVIMPFDSRSIMVRKADGSVAFDPYNEYSALPSLLARYLVGQAMGDSGKFELVVNAISSVRTECSAEVLITRLDLDCRRHGSRLAEAEVLMRIVRDGKLVSVVNGSASVDAKSGNYGAAMSEALSQAVIKALAELR